MRLYLWCKRSFTEFLKPMLKTKYSDLNVDGSSIRKPPSEDNIFHMKRELGDIMWYWVTACAALNLDPYEVISENQEKLAARYGEKFEVGRSEVRKEGDL